LGAKRGCGEKGADAEEEKLGTLGVIFSRRHDTGNHVKASKDSEFLARQ
jgi:hypothetical protein